VVPVAYSLLDQLIVRVTGKAGKPVEDSESSLSAT
jgi:hypothetical protein